jgi:hypothetical protein
MTNAMYEVVPEGQAWRVRMAGDSVSELYADKGAAIHRARELGRRYDAWRVRVLTENGRVETELSSSEARSPS